MIKFEWFLLKFWFFWLNFMRFWWILKSRFLENFDDKIEKMLECRILSKILKFDLFFNNFVVILIFWCTNFNKLLRFLQNHNFRVSEFCDQVVKFVWRAWCRLVDQTIVTHCHTSPLERSHSSDIDSRKNGFKIRHNGPQNVETKSSSKNSWWYHGQHTSYV